MIKSQCCDHEIIQSNEDFVPDKCGKCNRNMHYALGQSHDGVVKLIDGNL